MDIKNKSTLAEKQAYWAEQLPNFESKYWLPSHFEFLAFDMDQGNYTIKDDLDPSFEDDATEIWHRVNTGWAMWKKAINFSKPHEGFVLVPKEPTTHQVDYCQSMKFKKGVGRSHKFEDIFVYKAMIEAQEQSHD